MDGDLFGKADKSSGFGRLKFDRVSTAEEDVSCGEAKCGRGRVG